MQEALVILVVSAATFFVGRMLYKQFFAKETKCDSCAFSEFDPKSLGNNT